MKRIFYLLLLVFTTYFSYGQENALKKTERVIIANDEIITMEKMSEYGEQGYISEMHVGVSDEVRAELFKKFGDKIGSKENIIQIFFRTEEEVQRRKKYEELLKNNPQKTDSPHFLNINDSAKDFTVQMINGEQIRLSDLNGQVVLLNFWATWCGPCLKEFSEFPSRIIEPFKNSKFVLLPISRGETMDKVKEKMSQLKKDGIDFNVGIDPDESIFYTYTTWGLPVNFLIDKKGVIRYISIGLSGDSMDTISSMIKKLLKE